MVAVLTRAIGLFLLGYSFLLASVLICSLAAIAVFEPKLSVIDLTQTAGLAINLLCFFGALTIATSYRFQSFFGNETSPNVLRRELQRSRLVLVVSCALGAVFIDVIAKTAAQSFYQGQTDLPAIGRMAVMFGVYCVLSWIGLSEKVKAKG